MEFLHEFNRIMENTNDMALATSVDAVPNVRIVNFLYQPEKKGIVYFSTFKNKPKTFEFAQNNQVALTTIPVGTYEHIRVTKATVQKSGLTAFDLKDAFVNKYPNYETLIAEAGVMLEIYEIHFREATVTLSIDKKGKVNL